MRFPPYGRSFALLTDLYQVTMAYAYWKDGRADDHAVFHHYFRKAPFGGAHAIVCGLDPLIDFIESFRIDASDALYLGSLLGQDEAPLFDPVFIDFLRNRRLRLTIDALPEGEIAFANEPIVRVAGPLLDAQLLESAILCLINFPTLIATKAARVKVAAGDATVLEFGLRRAPGTDGGLAASRAAYVGGADATSNLLAGKLWGIPVRGTHAHSFVTAYVEELEAFRAYARALPGQCVFLVDTYDTLEGVRNAARVGKELREAGHELVGVRLDSGDLAALSIEARKILDDAGFEKALIYASNDLDEQAIADLRARGAKIDSFGVGTALVIGKGDGALGGVYKLSGIRDRDGRFSRRMKLSNEIGKASIPGILEVRRFEAQGRPVGDVIFDESLGESTGRRGRSLDRTTVFEAPADATSRDLLVRVFEDGRMVYPREPLSASRDRALLNTRRFASAVSPYPVVLDASADAERLRLLAAARDRRS